MNTSGVHITWMTVVLEVMPAAVNLTSALKKKVRQTPLVT
jgi:hypothetical protein